jgi:hypothetical protein
MALGNLNKECRRAKDVTFSQEKTIVNPKQGKIQQ